MTKSLLIISCLVMFGCGYDKFETYLMPTQNIPTPTVTIEQLNSQHTDEDIVINQDFIVKGFVTSSDRGNNFFKSFLIQDQSGHAVEIMAGLYNLSNIYPVGQHIVVATRGLTLGMSNSVHQLGIAKQPGLGSGVDYFGYRTELDRYVMRADQRSVITPQTIPIANLSQSMCGQLIRLDNLRSIDDGSTTWGTTIMGEPSTAYRQFTDQASNNIYVMVSPYANFAARIIPSSNISLTGILQYGKIGTTNSHYILKIRDIADVIAL